GRGHTAPRQSMRTCTRNGPSSRVTVRSTRLNALARRCLCLPNHHITRHPPGSALPWVGCRPQCLFAAIVPCPICLLISLCCPPFSNIAPVHYATAGGRRGTAPDFA